MIQSNRGSDSATGVNKQSPQAKPVKKEIVLYPLGNALYILAACRRQTLRVACFPVRLHRLANASSTRRKTESDIG